MNEPDVLIIGSGIVGCSCAYFLAKAGVNVMLVDRIQIGSGTSKAGMTYITTWEGPKINIDLSLVSNKIYRDLYQEVQVDFESRETGGLIVIENQKEYDAFMAEVEHFAGWGVNYEILSSVLDSNSRGVVGSQVIYQTRNGNPLLGSSREFLGFDMSVDPIVMATIISRCIRLMPALNKVSAIRAWSGLRPYCEDFLPNISPVDEISGLYIAIGHEGLEITEGPITGKLISQLITGETPDVAIDQLAFSRFLYKRVAEKATAL